MNGKAGWVAETVLEFKPLVYFYRDLHYHWIIYYWVMLGVLAALLAAKYIIRKKFDPAEFLAVCFINLFANFYSRGLMFSMVISTFYLGKSLHELWEIREGLRPRLLVKSVVALVLAALITTGFLFIREIKPNVGWALKPGITDEWVTPWYPFAAVKFMKENRIEPPMYNYYSWGGFLIFAAYPDYKVFIDGRALDNDIAVIADGILKTHNGWQQSLDAYAVNFILVPAIYRESGDIVPIVEALAYNSGWELVFLDFNSALYVRKAPANEHIIRRYRQNKMNVYNRIIELEDMFILTNPRNPIYWRSKSAALFALGRKEEATEIYKTLPPELQ